MAIRAVSRTEFDAFGPTRLPLAEMTIVEVEWFADDNGVVIGLIAHHGSDREWSLAVLGRDAHGTFRAFDADANIGRLDDARRFLFARMEMALANGHTIFPEDD